MKNLIISNPKKLEKLISRIKSDGFKGLHILTDFDKTLTYNFINGQETQSMIAILRDEKYLTDDYPQKAQKLADKYIPIENNPKIQRSKKKKAMERWWNEHFKLLIKSKLSKKDIFKVASSSKIKLRKGVKKFFEILNDYKIPVVILSAAGLGKDSIETILKKNDIDFKNIHIISNGFVWDKQGVAVNIKKPLVHSLNKDETILSKYPFYHKIKNRKNVILLGDGLDDVDMARGIKHKNIIKIGFLNKDVKKLLKVYQANFDLIIKNDGNFIEINKTLLKLS